MILNKKNDFTFWIRYGISTNFGMIVLDYPKSEVTQCAHHHDYYYYWQDASIKFTHRPKIRFFAPQGRLVRPIHVKLGRADGHMGPLGCAKFHLNHHRGWECGPKNIKNFHSLDRFRKFLGAFIMSKHRASRMVQLWRDSLHRLQSYCSETARRSIRPNFSMHPVGKTMSLDRKMTDTFLMASTSSITMQSLGKIVQRVPAVGAKTWCLYVF